MSNEVEIIVVSKDKTDAGFASARKAGKDTAEDIAKAMGLGADKAGKNVEKSFLGSFKSLAGSALKGGAEVGTQLGTSIGKSASSMLESTGPGGAAIGAALVGAGLAAAPFLGAAVSAAMLGGAGAGGILGGILLVKDNAQVKSAASQAGQSIMANLKADATPFIGPVIAGIGIIEKAFAKADGNFSRVFSKAATWIEPLATAVSSFIDDASAGFADMVEGADLPMKALTHGIEYLGEVTHDVFSDFSDNGADAALAIDVAFDAIGTTVKVVADAFDGLSMSFGFLARAGLFGEAYRVDAIAYKVAADEAKNSTDKMTGALKDEGSAAEDTRSEMQKLSDTLKAQYDPAFALIDAQQQNTEAQKKYASAVKKSGTNSDEAKDALVGMAKAALRLQAASAEAAGGQITMTDQLHATLLAAGWTEGQIRALGKSFDAARIKGDNFAKTYRADFVRVNRTYDYHYTKNTIITERTSSGESAAHGFASGGVVGAATGGARSGLTMVGEAGRELVKLPAGSQVIPNGQTEQMMSGQGGSGGHVEVTINFAGNLSQAFATQFQKELRSGNITIPARFVTA